ncbi:MAG: hypothetical protein R3F61_25150 [Myxococcota bacterium]
MRTPLLLTILASLPMAGCTVQKGEWTDTSMCIDVPDDATECPAAAEVDTTSMTNFGWCSADVRELTGEGTISENPFSGDTDGADLYCCYPAEARDADPGCVVGRPFLEQGVAARAGLRPGTSWSAGGSCGSRGGSRAGRRRGRARSHVRESGAGAVGFRVGPGVASSAVSSSGIAGWSYCRAAGSGAGRAPSARR